MRIINSQQTDNKTISFLLAIVLIGRSFDVFSMMIHNIDNVLKGAENSFDIRKLIEFLATAYLLYLARKKQRGVRARDEA